MSVTWTNEQRQAIELRDRNILVSAAAGSGKTAVLVERIKQRILDQEHPIDVDRMLVVTFTNAAAAQMKERVAQALEQELKVHPADARLQRQCALVQNAQITTIDSFCLYVIRNHFHEIDLEPDFRIADEGELKLLREDVLSRRMEQCYEERDPDFLYLVEAYGTARSDETLRDMILQLYRQAQSYPWPDRWLSEASSCYNVHTEEEFAASPWIDAACSYGKRIIRGLLARAEGYLALCQDGDGPFMYEAACQNDVEQLEELAQLSSYEEIAAGLLNIAFGALGRSKSFEGSVEKQELVKAERKAVKDMVAKLREEFFALTPEEHRRQLVAIRPAAEALVRVTQQFAEDFAASKRAQNIVDFSDLEHMALRILVDEETGEPTPVAREFAASYEEIIIDEYQDSNYIQETILRGVSRETAGENNIFMVGDVKQSIYRFRLARPELFMEKYDTYSIKDGTCQRVDLHKNFRSRGEVLDCVNQVFYRIMKRDLGGVDYDDAAALYCGASYPQEEAVSCHSVTSCADGFEAELLIGEKDADAMAEEGMTGQELEARLVANRIRELMRTGRVTDEETGELRPLRYQDIVILLRSVSDWGDTFARILVSSGIPAHTLSRSGYFSAMEVQTVLNYLRVLDNPRQDIPLTAVLRSPIVGLSHEELAALRIMEPDVPFHMCVLHVLESLGEQEAVSLDDSVRQKLVQFQNTYRKLRERVMDVPIHELLLSLLLETGYGDYAAAMPGGRQRAANLHMLVDKAVDYEKTSYRGLFHFIRYIDELQRYEVDFGEADLMGENDDAVRIMSIHKSKGLEFPVCFVSGMGKSFNKQDSRSRMVLHPVLGMGLDEIDVNRRIKIPAFAKRVIARMTELDNLGEELRVLYVAMTRAKEKLIMTGVCKDAVEWADRQHACAAEEMTYLTRSSAKNYLEWVFPAVAGSGRCFVKVMTMEDMVWQEAAEQLTMQNDLKERLQQAGKQDHAGYDELHRVLSLRYEYPDAVDMVTKYSVSELKARAMRSAAQAEELDVTPVFLEEVASPYIPSFMEEKAQENQGALRGTAMHRVMECFDFGQLPREPEKIQENLEKQLTQLLSAGKVTDDMCGLVRKDALLSFLKSGLAGRMREAADGNRLFREKPFVMGRKETQDGEMILIQGIIDVFWLEEDGIVLLDYKTDRVDSEEQLVHMYAEQLELYRDALERIFPEHIRVKEKYLYSFRLNRAIRV
ncbi:MAG: helicase-exonuclease AddAB subunit AddA [Lachnospiraceae bacterium]|nr:helicase-exonuclease AddAB subunit AddA [Lachnospiraceae bacterium]